MRSFNIFVSSDSEDPTLSTDKELCLFRALPIVDNGMWLGCESEKVGRYEKLYIYMRDRLYAYALIIGNYV